MVRKNNETQINGEKLLEDLTDSVKFMSSKFDECEKERLEREARIVEIESKFVYLSTKVEKLEYTADRMEKYSRCNSILLHGLPEVKGEGTDSLVSEFALVIGLLWQCTFNTAYTLYFNENLYMSLIISYNGIFYKTCLPTFMLKLSREKYSVTLYKCM